MLGRLEARALNILEPQTYRDLLNNEPLNR